MAEHSISSFIYGICNDAVSSSCHMASDQWITANDELETMWNEAIAA
jgi:hypothetical protein